MIEPNSQINFLSVPFTDYKNVMDFDNINVQNSYFSNKVIFTLLKCSYIREGETFIIKVGKHIDSMRNCNYISYKNTFYSNKWFYGFITKLEYVNNSCTNVHCKMDVFQTYMFDYNIKKSYVERQHVTDYYNTLSDTPNQGKLKITQLEKYIIKNSHLDDSGLFLLMCNANPFMEDSTKSIQYQCDMGNYSIPCMTILCRNGSRISQIIQAISNVGRADRIQTAYYVPNGKSILDNIQVTEYKDENDLSSKGINFIELLTSINSDYFKSDFSLNVNNSFLFKKEISYPYTELEIVDSISGKSVTLDLVKFGNPLNPSFKINLNINENSSLEVVPLNYNGTGYSIENALVLEFNCKLPIFNNAFANYQRQNRDQNIINGIMTGGAMVGSLLTTNIGGAVSSLGNVANLLNQEKQSKQLPNQISGIEPSIFDYMNFDHYIEFRIKTMDDSHKQQARNFWSTFGYPINEMTNVLTNTNSKFNFVKCVDVNILSPNIPSDYMKELKQIYDNGVTIWHNENFLNY